MPRNPTIITLWTAAWEESRQGVTCPGEHVLSGRPAVHYVISRRVRDVAAADAYLVERGVSLRPDEVLGEVPERMSSDGYLVSTLVTDPVELAMFAALMAPDEQLGTVAADGRPPILLTEPEALKLFDSHYKGPGDVLFHREGQPWYNVPSQNADRETWKAGNYDPAPLQKWVDRVAAERERGMLTRRLRILSEKLTDDELMSMQAGMDLLAKAEEVRVLWRAEQPVPGVINDDFWVIHAANDGPIVVIINVYDETGAILGWWVVPPDEHERYLREEKPLWDAGVPYFEWWAAHPELHDRRPAD
jgi:hypothetical protein